MPEHLRAGGSLAGAASPEELGRRAPRRSVGERDLGQAGGVVRVETTYA